MSGYTVREAVSMNSFLDGFLDGFTGAGMFLGPKHRESVSMLYEDCSVDDTQWLADLQEVLLDVAQRTNAEQRSEVMEEVRKIARRVPLTSQTAVESGSGR